MSKMMILRSMARQTLAGKWLGMSGLGWAGCSPIRCFGRGGPIGDWWWILGWILFR
ncbi:hypothetical protein HanIR_Chr16g0827291 [Helianthus annuus]|nr:hypothetical protein HanIR_Chr16g0827291 [Helianthus annuus]